MKKLAVLILVLILVFAAMGAMADECAHQWQDGVCTICNQECAHSDRYLYNYNYDWSDESVKTTYVEIEGDNVNHTETTTGPCVVTYYCPVCGKCEDVSYPSYSTTRESRHSYNSEGVCSNCEHRNNCTHPRQREVVEVYSDEQVRYEPISDYSHNKIGNGFKYTECEDCYQALTEYEYINDGSLTRVEEHNYYTNDGYPSDTCQFWTKSPPARFVTQTSYENQQCVLVSRAAFRLQCLCTAFRYIIKAPAGQLPIHPTSAVQECYSCKDDCSR